MLSQCDHRLKWSWTDGRGWLGLGAFSASPLGEHVLSQFDLGRAKLCRTKALAPVSGASLLYRFPASSSEAMLASAADGLRAVLHAGQSPCPAQP